MPTTCPDPPKLEHGKYQLGVPSTFYAYGKHNDTVGIINPTGGVWICQTKFEILSFCHSIYFMALSSFKLARLISGTTAVYSCKKASFTLMCKNFGGDEEGEWKRCSGEKVQHCFVFFVFFDIFLQVQGGGVQPWLLCQLNLASTGWTRMQGMSRRRMWRKRSIWVFHLKVKHPKWSHFHQFVENVSHRKCYCFNMEFCKPIFLFICNDVFLWIVSNFRK